MPPAEQPPLLVAYDGSDQARAAVRQTAELFAHRRAIVATVWEPGLAFAPMTGVGGYGEMMLPTDPETVAAVDDAQREHASRVAREGADLARSLGLEAEAYPISDEVDVADTLIEMARDRQAAAVVVGSRGVSGLRSHLVGSVARKLIEHSDRPVVVVRTESP